jgi:hypothetical protein
VCEEGGRCEERGEERRHLDVVLEGKDVLVVGSRRVEPHAADAPRASVGVEVDVLGAVRPLERERELAHLGQRRPVDEDPQRD